MTVAGATALVGGCGSGESQRTGRSTSSKPGTPSRDAVTFEGGKLEGTVYLSAGRDSLNQDLYRARGSLDRAERLTKGGGSRR